MSSRYNEVKLQLLQKRLTMNDLCQDINACIQMVQRSPHLHKIITAYVVEALSLCNPTRDEYDYILKTIDFDMVPVEENPYWGSID